jgi:hypothetical protein
MLFMCPQHLIILSDNVYAIPELLGGLGSRPSDEFQRLVREVAQDFKLIKTLII